MVSEGDELRGFLATGELVIPYDDQWLVRVRHFRATGRWVGRVHIVRRPLSDYLRYEFAVYAHIVRVGEDVRILDLTDQPDPGLRVQQDFWLFDEARVVRMDYDEDGRQLGRELLEDVDPAPYVAWKRRVLELAVPVSRLPGQACRVRLEPDRAGEDRDDLASALLRLRRASGLSGERLARRCGMSQSKVSRIETGRLLPSVVDVEQMLTALGVDEVTKQELFALARVANAEYRDARLSVRRGLHHRQRELAALEQSATEVRHFLPALVTGLLQTPEYMRAAIATPVEPASSDVGKAVATKLERQAVLHDRGKRFSFLLTESAVRWQLCPPAVRALQLDRLVSLSRLPTVRIGVLQLAALVPDGAYHTFVTYDRRLVTVELFTGAAGAS